MLFLHRRTHICPQYHKECFKFISNTTRLPSTPPDQGTLASNTTSWPQTGLNCAKIATNTTKSLKFASNTTQFYQICHTIYKLFTSIELRHHKIVQNITLYHKISPLTPQDGTKFASNTTNSPLTYKIAPLKPQIRL